MGKSIVIVESPAKAKTIERYLGKDYLVRACAGHIKDLPKKSLGVDLKHDFQPTYRIIPGKEKVVRELKKTAEKSDAIYLAADPDREGEAICQHLAEELNGSKDRQMFRVLFNEITKNAIISAFDNPSQIDHHKVEAQQARRILDRLVGYKISPLLWQKVRRGLSAGRVQSVALRLIVDREKEIRAFVSEEYWNFTARLHAQNPPPFEAKAVKLNGKKFKISNQEEADRLLEELQKADFVVSDVQKKERKRNPVPPFITSKLQQEASRKLRFSVKKTMTLAQRLYEGIETGSEGLQGLITYLRTDSTRISNTALEEVRGYIDESYGSRYLPSKAQLYRGKKGAQDAHEAIRPTSVARTPEEVKPYVDRDEYRLYDLIWKRFVASQMNPAVFDQTDIEIAAGKAEFKAVGSIMKFDGFLKLYQEGRDDADQAESEEGDKNLPDVAVGEKLRVEKIVPEQKFTQPPPRYSEATLVKALEEKGIGRPSTYQQILAVIMRREYVSKDEGRFVPTETGEVVIDLLVNHFAEIFDYDYTARMERNLDEIESGKEDWIQTLHGFYQEFSKELQQAKKEMKNLKREEVPAGEQCEKCGSGMIIKWGRFGRFMACSNFPQCKNTKELRKEGSAPEQPQVEELEKEICEKCGKAMVLKKGRYGEFLACSGYPECKNTRKIVQTTGVKCPQCAEGEIVQRRSRKGKIFYGCGTYPKCRFILWQKPVGEACPQCGAPYLLEKSTKKEGLAHYCANKECGFKQAIESVAG